MTTYPHAPGFKEPAGTSQIAAVAEASRVEVLRQRILETLEGCPMTADECADRLGETVLSIRPRFSELRATGKIQPSGKRRPNTSGHSAVVWCVANK